jgi:hypothetical protein
MSLFLSLIIFSAMRKFWTRDVKVTKNPVVFGRGENKITVDFHGRAGNQMFQKYKQEKKQTRQQSS